MPAKKDYTIRDNAGFTVEKGDTVRVGFEGVVRDVTRDGYLIIRTKDGTLAHFDPSYQGVVKIHK